MFDILLQVLDDGRLTDGQGRTVDFTNTILILTSNLGSPILIDPTLTVEQKREQVMALVRTAFRPEFLNRLDDVVMFTALSEDDLAQIVELSVDALQRRLKDRRLTLAVTPDARAWLAERGYDPIFGARPLRRLIQSEIQDRLRHGAPVGRRARRRHRAVDVAADGSGLVLTSAGAAPDERADASASDGPDDEKSRLNCSTTEVPAECTAALAKASAAVSTHASTTRDSSMGRRVRGACSRSRSASGAASMSPSAPTAMTVTAARSSPKPNA